MRWFKQLFFSAARLWSEHRTLHKETWQQLMRRSPGFSVIRKERRKERGYRARNSFIGAMAQVIIAAFFLIGICFLPASFIDHYLYFLKWFKFDDDQKAFATISEVMGSTATIIGLSFVVIGFLFDIVRDKTQRTLEELFRATNLYYVFGISVISIMILVIINCFKYTVAAYTVRNFAVLSSVILLVDAGAIAFLFYKLLRFFNPERVTEIASRQMIDLAKFRMLDDHFIKASGKIYKEELVACGYEEKFEFTSFLMKGKPLPVWLKIGNVKEVNLIDVHFPLLRFLALRLKKRSTETGFASLECGSTIRSGQGILTLASGAKLSKWEQFILSTAYLTSIPSSDTDDFEVMKQQLEKRLLKASSDADLDAINLTLADIEKLYDIFYQSNA